MDIGSILLGILAFVVLLSVIIIIHELGHLITAKKFGVYCHEFSIGITNSRRRRCPFALSLLAAM